MIERIGPRTANRCACLALTGRFLLAGLSLTLPHAQAQEAGAMRVDVHGIAQVWVPPGRYLRGSDGDPPVPAPDWARPSYASEMPRHAVEISRGFWLDRLEVTNAAFAAFVNAGGYRNPGHWSAAGRAWLAQQDIGSLPVQCSGASLPDHPRVCVTWFEAEAYARWRGGRLATAAEWEYAARGPESRIYPWGNEFDPGRANVIGTRGTTPAGSYPAGASWIGALDLAGNAMEWVQDWLDPAWYQRQEAVDPQGPPSGTIKIEKGGWWGSSGFVVRAAYQHFEDPPEYQDHHIGFRIVTPAEGIP